MDNSCFCRKCFEKILENDPMNIFNIRMFLCDKCGNKRCPHSTDHELECTNSNEPRQAGSAYE
jgi:hypothetical protein